MTGIVYRHDWIEAALKGNGAPRICGVGGLELRCLRRRHAHEPARAFVLVEPPHHLQRKVAACNGAILVGHRVERQKRLAVLVRIPSRAACATHPIPSPVKRLVKWRALKRQLNALQAIEFFGKMPAESAKKRGQFVFLIYFFPCEKV